jgi:uncharacterized surface protein with fasciclin (FAS1) repeats
MTITTIMKSGVAALSLLALTGLAACAPSTPPMPPKMEEAKTEAPKVAVPTAPTDVVAAAMANPDFSTLVAAISAAGLADTLKGPGPFTILAPSNAAFAKLPAGTVEGLLKPEKKADLVKLLQGHVISGRIMAADLTGKTETPATLAGKPVAIDTKTPGTVKLGGATVTTADVITGNGVIHVIDTVILK